MAVNTILKESVLEWNLESYDSEGALKENLEVLDQAAEDIMASMESDLINFEEDYD